MRRIFLSIVSAALVAGPLTAVSQAGTMCDLQRKLGVVNVKECEDHF